MYREKRSYRQAGVPTSRKHPSDLPPIVVAETADAYVDVDADDPNSSQSAT